MKMKTVHKAVATGIFALSATCAMQASAAPTFTFTEYGGFEDDVPVADYSDPITFDANLTPATTPLYHTMSWVSGSSPQSSLELDTVTGPAALAADTWVTISTIYHNNVIIPNVLDWGPQDIWGRLRITDTDGGAEVVLDNTSAVTIALTESANVAPCSPPNPVGSTCDDYFSFTDVGLGDLLFTANDGSQWLATFQFANLNNAVQIGGTVYTGEAVTSSLDVQVMVTQVSTVPEPATLSILGLGLLGLGFASRRKQQAG